jgi:HEAT repeat protein
MSGQKSIQDWIIDLSSSDVNIRREAAISIYELGTNAREAIGPLITLKESDPQVRLYAISALSNMRVTEDEVILHLHGVQPPEK